uniref:Uncharacterized protein n=1 Tax=Oryza meridionalis TaxID=40149 RepID=A0A0E0ECG2_9ORYZ
MARQQNSVATATSLADWFEYLNGQENAKFFMNGTMQGNVLFLSTSSSSILVSVKNCVSVSYLSVHHTPRMAAPIWVVLILLCLPEMIPSRQFTHCSDGMPCMHCTSPYTVCPVSSNLCLPTAYLSGRLTAASVSARSTLVTRSSNCLATEAVTAFSALRHICEAGDKILVGEVYPGLVLVVIVGHLLGHGLGRNWVSVSYRSEHLTPWIAPPIVPPPIFRRLSATTPSRQLRQRSGGMSRVHCASPYTVRTVRSLSRDGHGASPAAYLSGLLAAASASEPRSSPTTSSNRSASAAGAVFRLVTSTHSGELLKAERKSWSEKRRWYSSS